MGVMKFRDALLASALVPLLSAPAAAFEFGVNTRHDPTLNAPVAALMKQRNLRSARMDMVANADPAALRDQAERIRANGGQVQVVLLTSWQWRHDCDPRLAEVEQKAYEETAAAVDKVKDVIHDFELLNESQLRPEIQREVAWNSARSSSAPYEGKACVATLSRVLRGMSRAVDDIRASSGLPLRRIMGVVGRDWGYLKFMRDQGVQWDVTGYHVYPHGYKPSLLGDPWYGPGGPLAQLAAFGKPVHINEFNCGEIYDAGFGNRPGDAGTEACLKGLARHLRELKGQRIAQVEWLHFYELFDEPAKAAPENRFGLLHDLQTPKPLLYLAAAFAGGELSAQERLELERRGLMPDADPGRVRAGIGRAASPPRAPIAWWPRR